MNFTGNPIALQLYTLRSECEKDFPATLKQVKACGYGAVEFAGLYNNDPILIKSLLDSINLQAPSCHIPLEQLQSNFKETVKIYKEILGCRYFVIPACPQDFAADNKIWFDFLEQLSSVAAQCKHHGVTLCYHNHAFEFEALSDGRSAFEAIFNSSSLSVEMELDVYWAEKAGVSPVNILNSRSFVPLLHLKDLDSSRSRDLPVGDGILNWDEIYAAAKRAQTEWLIVEQDNPGETPWNSVQTSLQNLRNAKLEF